MTADGIQADVPSRLFDLLVHGFMRDEAHQELRTVLRDDAGVPKPDVVLHPGDPVGWVLAWLWDSGLRAHAVDAVAVYLAQLRRWDENAITEPPGRVTLDRFLEGLPLALPSGFAHEAELIEVLRADVPKHFSSDLTT